MSSFRVRPRFQQLVPQDLETVQARIAQHLGREDSPCLVKSFPGFLSLRVLEKDAHFWSPQLHLSLEPAENGQTLVQGIYGPNPNVWSLFLYAYLLTGSVGLFAGLFGFSQWLIGHKPWGLWVLAATMAGAASLYLVAQLGQKLGAWQTFQLHQAYQSAIGQPVDIQ